MLLGKGGHCLSEVPAMYSRSPKLGVPQRLSDAMPEKAPASQIQQFLETAQNGGNSVFCAHSTLCIVSYSIHHSAKELEFVHDTTKDD